jgi:hypothetical protein
MKKLFCMIALGAITFGSVFAATPIHHFNSTMQTDTTTKVKKHKTKTKIKSDDATAKKDSTKM